MRRRHQKMPGNTKEKEKCMEKLNQMQKFLPFLDFMIDKIKKKNNEILLECQLSKLKVLRSMIAEKSDRYSWDVLIKVEDVIERLISKLNFKDQYEKSQECLTNSDYYKSSTATILSKVPSSITSASTSRNAVDFKAHEFSTNADDIKMKTLNVSVENSMNSTDRSKELLTNPILCNQPFDVTEKSIETDLDKDLDGFDLTDCPNFSESESSFSAPEHVSAATEKATYDLLSSSREKLLKSLQSKLLPCKSVLASSKSSTLVKNDKESKSQASGSAFSRPQISFSELKTNSDLSENSERGSRKIVETTVKHIPSSTVYSFSERMRKDSGSNYANLKQKLKEKFSTDICEVYRVPGKSVGGSLRSLKEPKDQKKNTYLEEDVLFKPDKITEKPVFQNTVSCNSRSSSSSINSNSNSNSSNNSSNISSSSSNSVLKSKSSSEKKENQSQKPHLDSSGYGVDKKKNKTDSKSSHKSILEKDEKPSKTQEKNFKKTENKSECESNSSKELKKSLLKKEDGSKYFELDKLNDEELLEFVKENMQYLPHLAKLKPTELRKAVKSSLGNLVAPEADSISEISDDSFQDSEEFVRMETKPPVFKKSDAFGDVKESPYPLGLVKVSQVGSDEVTKNVKPLIEPSRGTKVLEEVDEKTRLNDVLMEDDDLDEADYAQKLIEETTPVVASLKKKGLLELPMPVIDDLFHDISAIESFETFNSPNESGNLELTLSMVLEKNNKNKSEADADSDKTVPSPSSGRFNPHPEKDSTQNLISQSNFSSGAATDPRGNQNKSEFSLSKALPGHVSQGPNLFSTHQANESSTGVVRTIATYTNSNPSSNTIARRHSYNFGEPKSYVEYKQMKLKEKEKLNYLEVTLKENPKSNLFIDTIFSPAEREEAPKKFLYPKLSKSRDTFPKQSNSRSYYAGSNTCDDRKKLLHSGQRRYSDQSDSQMRVERKSHEDAGKIFEKKRYSVDSEELVSPLEELYRNDTKPKTGRGYGLQNFKIPKKVREFPNSSKLSENQTHLNASTTEVKTCISIQKEAESKERDRIQMNDCENEMETADVGSALMENRVERFRTYDEKSNESLNSICPKDALSKKVVNVYSNKSLTKTILSVKDPPRKSSALVNLNELKDIRETQDKSMPTQVTNEVAKPVSESTTNESKKLEIMQEVLSDEEKDERTKNECKMMKEEVKKCEAQIVECDSSVECSGIRDRNFGKELTPSVEKSSTMPKEEITQEFVEALIRKSFQSGEGKLLLAHAKLFEEFARKLNSKKLKTIQKIINSETDSSSSSADMYSEDEKKKKKSKRSNEKIITSKKLRKKGKKNKRPKSSSVSASSSESEETSEEECDKKESPTAGSDGRSAERSGGTPPFKGGRKIKRRRRYVEFGKDFSGGRAKRKQRQKKMLEKILSESPQSDQSQDANLSNPAEPSTKETEPRTKRMKGKVKTELDRLHDDLRSMFLSAGEVTQTGQRMCRILRQSGGNINNLDIVKESAKMVEEEKLRKVTRHCAKNPRMGNSEVRGKNQLFDKSNKNIQLEQEYGHDPKLACEPIVALQRVDLDNFGYAVKISNDCVSFKRMQGRNTAIRGIGSPGMPQNKLPDRRLERNVYLPRNRRKVERMSLLKCKKGFIGKKLMDVVQNLPLKMAKMKHLQICEKTEDEFTKNKKHSGKSTKKGGSRRSKSDLEFSNSELLNYAFERIRVMYSCKLCSQVTRYITGHYKEVHPDHEVLISRLRQGEAKKAKLDAKRNRYNLEEENSLVKSMKKKIKVLLNTPSLYHCRMCSTIKTQDLELFRAHVSSHTGEFRFQCPVEGCRRRTYSRQDIKIHILTKHSKNRAEYYKITELYKIVVEGSKMFGFLCSLCNFVQLNRNNVVEHMKRQHPSSVNAKIIKINMSGYAPKTVKKKYGNLQNEEKNVSLLDDKTKVGKFKGTEDTEERVTETKITVEGDCAQNRNSEEASLEKEFQTDVEDRINASETKKIFLIETADEEGEKSLKKSGDTSLDVSSGNMLEKYEVNVNLIGAVEEDKLEKDIEIKDCVNLKNIATLNETNKSNAVEGQEKVDIAVGTIGTGRESHGRCQKIKVGPLEAQLMENSVVLYECYVKGCLFFTPAFNLFEKHIQISHCKTKWDGYCEICATRKGLQPCKEDSFQLLTALRHLKLHEREKVSAGKLSKEDLIVELKLLKSAKECLMGDGETKMEVKGAEEDKGNNEEDGDAKKIRNSEAPYPAKPLLRVRNLLGDRLSTPKESPDENEVVAVNEEHVAIEESSDSMFTIENVRSLNDAPPEDSEIQIQHVCSLKDSPQTLSQLAPAKAILVRSCPSRKITIRPEPSSLSIDVGQLSVVQTPVASHPVVLSPLTSASPIRIISSSLPPKPKFTVQPILVSADPVKMNAPNVLSIISSTLSPVASTVVSTVVSPVASTVASTVVSTIESPVVSTVESPVVSTGESPVVSTVESPVVSTIESSFVSPVESPAVSTAVSTTMSSAVPVISPTLPPVVSTAASSPEKSVSPGPVSGESSPLAADASEPVLDVAVIPTPSKPTSPVSTLTNPIDIEVGDERDSTTLQRIHSSPNAGNKRVKDAKIYEEMLTKTKLCHLFKCMGIECSFTCNDECVFRQHIGLHEAQRRLKKNKGMRTIILRLASKTTKAFYWQQCSYCCELLTNTTSALSQHILEEHGHCMYQCGFCFYRAVSQSYVEIHQNLAHIQVLKTTPRVIYKCKPLRTPPSQAAALEKHRRRQSVRPYHCDQCGRKFFITQDFINHLTSQHQSVTAYTCHICKNLCFKADRLVVHYKLHSYCTYQCAYCLHGTETEKEMVFHLCNFHFSQPAVIYVRAFAKGRRQDVKEGQMKNKKHLSNQLDSLKVVVYESDTLNADCIVEVDPDEETSESGSEASRDLTAIVTELGINADAQSSSSVTPLMKELASIGEKTTKNLTVKTLLPNTQFSSENENCSVLISSGLSTPSGESNEKGMNIPLGQLPLKVVSIQHNESAPQKNISTPDKNLKLNEIIVNLHNKDKAMVLSGVEDEKNSSAVAVSSATHKLPPVVLNRCSTLKNVYSSRSAIAKKKSDESEKKEQSAWEDENLKSNCDSKDAKKIKKISKNPTQIRSTSKTEKNPPPVNDRSSFDTEPLVITSVVSLSNNEFDKESSEPENPFIISDVCSLSDKVDSNPPEILINIKSQVNGATVLKPPIIRVEDINVREANKDFTEENLSNSELPRKDEEKDFDNPEVTRSFSPDIIILEEQKSKKIITVTLDSDDENVCNTIKEPHPKGNVSQPLEDNTIRKEMELLRNQIASETDSLLFDEPEGEKVKSNLSLNIAPCTEDATPKSLLSPIEEAIYSLNKKLQSETEQAQKNEEEKKDRTETKKREDGNEEKKERKESAEKENKMMGEEEKRENVEKKLEIRENEVPERRRTRFAAKYKRHEKESSEKKEEDAFIKKEPAKWKKMKEGLVGKDLFICGNANCDFAADDDSTLKDHFYVCDFSRETSTMTCPHCRRQTKNFTPSSYVDHLKYHGEKKHHCGLCEYSAVDASVSRHVKQKHKCSVLKILPKDSQPGHLWYYPKNYKVEKIDFEVNGYSPGDEDKLPLQSVYQVNVKCAKCPYFTKVRSNMVRHLKIHLKSVETEGVVVVPSTAPTNPVPCLETKERMFDKMTNLAASSQLAQAKEKTAIESLSPEEEAKLPQFVAEQLRYKCCLPDCNYITVDEGMLRHHIKALHDEINYYSCPHCKDTVHVDVRHVTLDKIGHHLKHHDLKLYKCAHCIYFHYQKNVVEKHTVEKHPDRRYFVHTVREPKPQAPGDDDNSSNEGEGPRVWKCALCENFRSPCKATVKDHLLKSHNIKSKYRCKLCPMKGNNYNAFCSHFASKHPGEKVSYMKVCLSEKLGAGCLESGNSSGADSSSEHFDTTPLWQRGTPRIRHIRGILIEEEEIKTKKSKKGNVEESETETPECATATDKNVFYCPLCTNKKKPFFTRSEDYFRTHLYQELNYQQFACILCGKMFVDKKDFYRHHARIHRDKAPALKRTKEDHEIKFWVDKVIARRLQQLEERKRKLSSDGEASGSQRPPPKKKKSETSANVSSNS